MYIVTLLFAVVVAVLVYCLIRAAFVCVGGALCFRCVDGLCFDCVVWVLLLESTDSVFLLSVL